MEVDLWDTAGQERFQSLHPGFYHGAHAAILVFDVTRKPTYKNLAVWYKELRSFRPNIPVVVIANKIDENPKSTQIQFNFAKKNDLEMNYTSGKQKMDDYQKCFSKPEIKCTFLFCSLKNSSLSK